MGGLKSYHSKKALSSINRSILSGSIHIYQTLSGLIPHDVHSENNERGPPISCKVTSSRDSKMTL
jgi:hypothetical protein